MNNVVWQPQPGSQTYFLTCPFFEALYEGTRGPGKTDALIMDFAQHVGQGFGPAWRGVLFRETYKQLSDIVAKTKRWFYQIFPGASFNASDFKWTFNDGEELLLRHMARTDDYWNYHGHEYPWIGWEELTNWAMGDCYEMMVTCCRSSHPDLKMPRKYRATCNPYGIGHHWVKSRFIDPAPPGIPIEDESGRIRVSLHGNIYENRILLKNDPDYLKNLQSITDENKRKAWLDGSWDIVAGGILADVWNKNIHVIKPFAIPKQWRINRSFDWGSSHPFSVCWWAESNGESVEIGDKKQKFPKGTLFQVAEWYGWNGKPNEGCRMLASEIARGILEREMAIGFGSRVAAGPADPSIYNAQNGNCIADDMARLGVRWELANNNRLNGWEKLRQMLKAGTVFPMEDPGIFFFETCRHSIRTLPVLPRDEKNMDDADTDSEDHVADSVRYRVMAPIRTATQTRIKGLY